MHKLVIFAHILNMGVYYMKKNDIIEHLYAKNIIDEDMKKAIYSYYEYLDLTQEVNEKFPEVIYV